MKDKEYITIRKMIEYIEKALRYTKNCSFKDFSNNEEKVDATILAISQIGELVKNISEDTMKNYPNLRNKIVHDYEGIKLDFIWDITQNDIPQLKKDLEQILKENEP